MGPVAAGQEAVAAGRLQRPGPARLRDGLPSASASAAPLLGDAARPALDAWEGSRGAALKSCPRGRLPPFPRPPRPLCRGLTPPSPPGNYEDLEGGPPLGAALGHEYSCTEDVVVNKVVVQKRIERVHVVST